MAGRAGGEQLSLAIEPPTGAAGLPRLAPMTPLDGGAPFDDGDWFFEPWWPGAPTLAYLEGGRLRLQVEHMADPNTAFADLEGVAGQFGDDGLILAGTLLVLDADGRPDADLLRRRLATDGPPAGVPALVCSDLLYVRGRPLVDQPFEDRRAQLARTLRDGDSCVISRGLRGEGTTLAEAAASMGLAEISARRLDGRYQPGGGDGSWLRLPVAVAPEPSTRPLLALLQRLPL